MIRESDDPVFPESKSGTDMEEYSERAGEAGVPMRSIPA